MTRYGGLILVLVLALVALGLRVRTHARADTLLEGELHGRRTLEALYQQGMESVAAGRPHPGLEALVPAHPGMELLEGLSTPDRTYARDEHYVYAFATTTVGTARRTHGFILRAWPRRFGVTGDREFHFDEAGILYEGLNRKGRSGTESSGGFPPAMPDPLLGQPNSPWFPAPQLPARAPADGAPASAAQR
jgi:hypothetical protein